MKKLLIVDDEQKIRSLVGMYSKYEGFTSVECSNGKECVDYLKNNDVDIVVLDVMMPELDGFSTLKKIREFSDVPVIMLTAKGDVEDKIVGFSSGADDYLPKPFSPKELMLRINAVLKRSTKKRSSGLVIDEDARKVYVNGQDAELSYKEYELLSYFVKNEGIALTRDRIIENVWSDFDGFDRTVDAHVKSLRKKLGDFSERIQTVRGVGYRFENEKD